MAHYEERMERDLSSIKDGLRKVGEQIHTALERSVHALLNHDRELAGQVVLGDLPINRAVRELDRRCHEFVARHLPSAGPLRFVSSTLRLNVELERIGDYAVTIARETVQLNGPPPETIHNEIELMADQVRELFRQATQSFNDGNAELARGTKSMAKQIERSLRKAYGRLTHPENATAVDLQERFAHLVILTRLGRVSDQSKNICEETLFAVTGETKAPKVYRILFIDQHGDRLCQMAAAYARKAFPEIGIYDTAGLEPASDSDPQAQIFLDRNGYDTRQLTPQPFPTADQQDDYHVIVSLAGNAWERFPDLPFHTVLLHWEVSAPSTDLDQERTQAGLERSHRELTSNIQQLMDLLRGSENH